MSVDVITPLLGWAQAHLLVLAIVAARMSALVQVSPPFTRLGLVGLLRNAIALVLSAPLLPGLFEPALAAAAEGLMRALALTLKEALLGAVLGALLGLPFWAAEAAGDLIDNQRGSDAALTPDPSGTTEASVIGTLFVLILLVIFFAGGGLELMLDAVYGSFTVWPVERFFPVLTAPEAGRYALLLLDRLLSLALLLGGPIVLAMLFAELALALIGRVAPQLNIFDLALAVKSLVGVLVLPLYALFLTDHLRDALGLLRGLPAELFRLVQ